MEWLTGSLEEAVAAFRAGRHAAKQAGDRFTMTRLDMLLGDTLRLMGAPAAARKPLTSASALPPTDQASRAVALQSLFLLGLVEYYLHEAAVAAEVAARCEAMLRPDDPSQWRPWLSDLRALIALVTGDHAAALAEVECGIAGYADSPEQATVGYLLNVRGLVLLA
jgi:hypothetical protein